MAKKIVNLQKSGWVKFYRKSLDSSVFKSPTVWWVWSWCLLKANHQDNKFPFNGKDIIVKNGQFITGRAKACEELKLTQQSYRTVIEYLKKTSRITTQSTNRFTMITIEKWAEYQLDDRKYNQQTNQPLTNQQPTTNQPLTTNNKEKPGGHYKNGKNPQATACRKRIDFLIEKFELVNPSYEILFKNVSQRKALERMVEKYDYEKIVEMIEALPEIVSREYAPRITTPVQLESKLGQLLIFIKQHKKKGVIKT